MKSLILISSLVFVSSAFSSSICKNPLLKASQQMIINILPDEKTIYAKTYLVENKEIINTFKAVIGRNGLSWNKKEGDGKAPAGVYSLLFGFGLADKIDSQKFSYTPVGENSHCIDDSSHPQYNKILFDYQKPKNISSENLKKVGAAYEFTVAVNYNHLKSDSELKPIKNNGSCIFLHVWKKNNDGSIKPTAGCTAFERENMKFIINWLDKKKNPILIQLTKNDYQSNAHCLPKISPK